jgi:hypothetical protein
MSDIGFGSFFLVFVLSIGKTAIVHMRPGIARAFSATQRIGQQQLFEPYIPPLNQEQKKALRKIAKADEPHYHGHMSKDAVWLLAVRALSWLRLEYLLIICRLTTVRIPRGYC